MFYLVKKYYVFLLLKEPLLKNLNLILYRKHYALFI